MDPIDFSDTRNNGLSHLFAGLQPLSSPAFEVHGRRPHLAHGGTQSYPTDTCLDSHQLHGCLDIGIPSANISFFLEPHDMPCRGNCPRDKGMEASGKECQEVCPRELLTHQQCQPRVFTRLVYEAPPCLVSWYLLPYFMAANTNGRQVREAKACSVL